MRRTIYATECVVMMNLLRMMDFLRVMHLVLHGVDCGGVGRIRGGRDRDRVVVQFEGVGVTWTKR